MYYVSGPSIQKKINSLPTLVASCLLKLAQAPVELSYSYRQKSQLQAGSGVIIQATEETKAEKESWNGKGKLKLEMVVNLLREKCGYNT